MISLEIEVMCNICMINKDNLIKCNNCVFNMCEDCFLIYVKDKKNCPHCNIIIPENLITSNKFSNIIIYPNNKRKIKFYLYCTFLIFCPLWTFWWTYCFIYFRNYNYNNNNSTIYNTTL